MQFSKTSFLLLALVSFGYLALVYSHDPRYQRQTLTQEECGVRKLETDYTAQGFTFTLGNLSIYETKDTTPSPNRLLIGVYDIFGDTKNTHQFADLLASAYGFRIVIPDFFRGQPWEHTKWPPVPAEFQSWRDKITNWDTIVKYDIRAILNHYWTTFGIKDIGIFGFCWGGLVSTLAATHMPEIKAAGLIHPSFLTDDMAQGVKAPTYMFPCKNDPDLTPFYNVIRDKFGDNSGHRRYDDMCHGFSTSMGNFSNPLNFQRVEQTIDILGNFFQRNMPRLAKD